jgi:DNA helicase-2/ATP-dependent DNA helicase PcrA
MDLNNKQIGAIEYHGDELLILAGAGSGKTRCVTEKVRELFSSGLDAENVLAITFTNKAANEMINRISKFHPISRDRCYISTFHSFCYRLIRDNVFYFGLNKVRVCNDSQSTALIKDAIISIGNNPSEIIRKASYKIERLKNRLIYPGDEELSGDWVEPIYEEYENLLKHCLLFDFNDLISKTVLMLRDNESTRLQYQKQFKHIIIDEFQDVNNAQFELVKLLHNSKYNKLMIVGDDSQAIYGFRDSDPSFIINFTSQYPSAYVIKLEQNYRSTRKILDVANHIISQNTDGLQKNLWTENKDGGDVVVNVFESDESEAEFIARKVAQEVRVNGRNYSDFCVLYRLNAQSRNVEDGLVACGIPAQVVRGVSFYERMEVKDILSYLRFIDNPFDILSFKRCACTPKRDIGVKTINDIIGKSNLTHTSIMKVLSSHKKESVGSFYNLINELSYYRHNVLELINNLIINIDYPGYILKTKGPSEVTQRMESMGQLMNIAINQADDCSLQSFLRFISLRSDLDQREDENSVRLSTIHGAKGLEFDIVFLIGMHEGIFPHAAMDMNISEARRLFYVAITRAKQGLFITHTKFSLRFGRTEKNKPSVFLSELPEHIIVNGGSSDLLNTRESEERERYCF